MSQPRTGLAEGLCDDEPLPAIDLMVCKFKDPLCDFIHTGTPMDGDFTFSIVKSAARADFDS